MRRAFIPAIVTAVLILAIVVVFKNILHKPSEVVPLFLVPALLYIGYLTSKLPKVWMLTTIAITVLMAILYALP
jgi:hypothetical protein